MPSQFFFVNVCFSWSRTVRSILNLESWDRLLLCGWALGLFPRLRTLQTYRPKSVSWIEARIPRCLNLRRSRHCGDQIQNLPPFRFLNPTELQFRLWEPTCVVVWNLQLDPYSLLEFEAWRFFGFDSLISFHFGSLAVSCPKITIC